MPTLSEIEKALRSYHPGRVPAANRTPAAVAMLLREAPGGADLLLVERACHPGDPWSGDLGFPGGKLAAEDTDLRQAALRETREELGLDLAQARYFGRLADLPGAHLPVLVRCFVYQVPGDVALHPNHELQATHWVPLATLYDPARQVMAAVRFRESDLLRPAIRLPLPGRDILWGITYRLVMALADQVPGLAGAAKV
ncbi:CoA pyrophosphatase [Desulfuromonas carbonis]|uniref:NUDIX hydrolase n=1 Tax=Desulfuromonas sp. DDH964 TaxID=1823759 RepID=UPI00078D6B3E|nr:CoA pyrophosphatase [Desulfuromonas sp. DDH964]AMV72453.1 NUDIX hydrolase, coenzyme A pyrophosphatase family [Desulfuromonas sp. DDH964]